MMISGLGEGLETPGILRNFLLVLQQGLLQAPLQVSSSALVFWTILVSSSSIPPSIVHIQ